MAESLLLFLTISAMQASLVVVLAGILFWYADELTEPYLKKWAWSMVALAVSIIGSSIAFSLMSDGVAASQGHRLITTVLTQVGIYCHLTLLVLGAFELLFKRSLTQASMLTIAVLFALMCSLLFAFDPQAAIPRLVLRVAMHYFAAGVIGLMLGFAVHRKLRERGKVLRNAFLLFAGCQLGLLTLFVSQAVIGPEAAAKLVVIGDLLSITMLGAGMVLWLIESERARGSQANADVLRLTQYDTETGLSNQTRVLQLSDDQMKRQLRPGIMVIDLDHFRSIGDSLVREQVLEVFHELARRIRSCLPSSATLARLKHDTFAVLIPEARPEQLERIADEVHIALSPEIRVAERQLFLTGSIGMAIAPLDANTGDALLRAALLAVNQCKSLGRGRSRFYAPELNEQADLRLGLIAELRRALNEDQLVLHFQPIFGLRAPPNIHAEKRASTPDTSSIRRLVGFEALLRWQHPVRGLLPPSEFVHALEVAGIAEAVDQMVLRKAIKQIKEWRLSSKQELSMAVNMSAASFQSHGLPKLVESLLNESALSASAIELEITESMALSNVDLGLALLSQLRAMGVNVSLDDFGTGYSSLSHLRLLPVSRIKIDRSFIRDILSDRKDAAIVSALCDLAHCLDLTVVAEGVESHDQLAFLQSHGVDFIQGFLLSKPLDAEHAAQLVAGRDFEELGRGKVTSLVGRG